MPICRRARRTAAPFARLISWPSKAIVPALGRTRPLMQRRKVDFPAPEGPITARNSPGRTSTLTSNRACTPLGNCLLTPRVTICAPAGKRERSTSTMRLLPAASSAAPTASWAGSPPVYAAGGDHLDRLPHHDAALWRGLWRRRRRGGRRRAGIALEQVGRNRLHGVAEAVVIAVRDRAEGADAEQIVEHRLALGVGRVLEQRGADLAGQRLRQVLAHDLRVAGDQDRRIDHLGFIQDVGKLVFDLFIRAGVVVDGAGVGLALVDGNRDRALVGDVDRLEVLVRVDAGLDQRAFGHQAAGGRGRVAEGEALAL